MTNTSAPIHGGRERSHLISIMALAIVARIVFAVFVLGAGPSAPITSITSWNYEDVFIAVSLIHGGGYSSPFHFPSGPTALLAPGYPLLIAAVIRFTGTGRLAVFAMIGLQIFFSILIIPLIMWMTRRYFGTRAANLAGFIYAISEPMLVLPLYIWDTCLSALLLMAAIALASRPRWKTQWYSLASGAGCAIATLVNPTLLPSLAAVFGWSAWRSRIVPWLAALTFLIVLSPWPIRNLRVMHSFIPFRSTINYELWEGNHPGADGNVPNDASPLMSPRERELFLANGEVGYMRLKGSLTRAYISTHKIEFVKLSMKRVVRFWSGDSDSPGPMTAILSLLAFSGLILAWRQRRTIALLILPIAIYPLPFYITHPNARYQFVIDPLLAIFAGYACESLLAFFARRPLPAPAIPPEIASDQPVA
jgi:hypothetical protein